MAEIPTTDDLTHTPDVWKAMVGSILLEQGYSYCYYFVEGHLHQLQPGIFPGRHEELNPDPRASVPPSYLCAVISRDLCFTTETEEPFVRYRLLPVNVWYKASDAPDTDDNTPDTNNNEIVHQLILLQTPDLEELSVPDDVVDKIFKAQSTVQVIHAKDVFGVDWRFERDHHLLKTGWREFVAAKRLKVGDHVLFLRKRSVICVGIRKTRPINLGPVSEVQRCMIAAEGGQEFDVDYYPRKAVDAFVVSADIVFEASNTIWVTGLKVHKSGTDFVEGKVTRAHVRKPEKGDGKHSGWNMLTVKWEGVFASAHRPWVNAWDLIIHGSRFGPLPQPQANAEKGQETQDAAGTRTRTQGNPINIANYPSVWSSLAGEPFHLPQTDSYCYYFSEGHLEQVCINNPNIELNLHSAATAPPAYLCKITSRDLDFHRPTEEPFVRYGLQPVEVWYNVPGVGVAPRDAQSPKPQSVLLTPTDLEELTIPDAIATQIFRTDNRVAQIIKAVDVLGAEWTFERVLRSDRHLLIKGWKDFVHAKRLVTGDTVLFMRRINTIFVCIRKSGQIFLGDADDATEAMKAAEKGSGFFVTYYPRKAVSFVISADIVVEASLKWWHPGLQVSKLQVHIPGRALPRGEITKVVCRKPERGAGTLSGWNMLQVNWEDEACTSRPWVNAWDVINSGLRFGPLPQPQEKARKKQKTEDTAEKGI